MSEDRRRQTGLAGETAACRYLENEGYTVIERNWRCRSGEIDIIASIDDTLIFVEVRTRRAGGRFGTAAESVDRRKQQQVALVAQVYLRMRQLNYPPMRFDVIAVSMNRDDSISEIKHIKAAF
ncbi:MULTISPECIES: YraN family protein [unclassified Paenibacillus]|uniref:YraN family protein n=1 Tax=unclassified Paenibacillus TaxID=185978 RepID=UPI00104A29A1|nr:MULTISPECIES: YraN family protein [unclassified Paenibacillus]NIK68812.1 putative endonuclease [Paenibacillus sp. BK720]TCM98915.1 putative endonuclease [Paenibacillus sp. BK033]